MKTENVNKAEQGRKKLLILGVHLKSDGYPNVKFRIADLKKQESLDVREINVPMWTETTQHINGRRRLIRNLFRIFYSHVSVLGRFLVYGSASTIYVPYPAVFILYILSFLPIRLRPKKILADAFISLYDTIVIDRELYPQEHILSRILKRIEKRAYAISDVVIVDTQSNAAYISTLFDIRTEKLVSIPLSTDEDNFNAKRYIPSDVCRVLFIGTFSALHGADVIARTANLLKHRTHIRFRLIGDGQVGEEVATYLAGCGVDVEWQRAWAGSEQLASEIERADICLGIFGETDKAGRVCPLKIYAYAACGRPIITRRNAAFETRLSEDGEVQPFLFVPCGSAEALAEAINTLADDADLRRAFAKRSREFYGDRLANEIAFAKLERLID